MTSVSADRRFGVNTGAALKVPVRAATTANVTLSGEQTVDGVALVTNDRVLVKSQTAGANNGIYLVDTGTWTRSPDWDGSYDVVTGTAVYVTAGTTNSGSYWAVSTTGTITVGTTSVAFTNAVISSAAAISTIQSGTGAVSRTVQAKARETVSITDFGAVADSSTNNATAIQAAIDTGAGRIYVPGATLTYKYGSALSLKKNQIIEGDGKLSVLSYTGAGVAVQALGSLDAWSSALKYLRITTSTGTHGVRLKDLAQFELQGVNIDGFSTAGLHLTGTAVTGICINIALHDNWITANTGKGILADTINNINQVSLRGNRIQGNTLAGISIETAGLGWAIVGNDIEGNGGTAELYINGGNCSGVEIAGNYFESSTAHPAILAADTQAQYGISIHGNFFIADVAITNAITLGVSAAVTGVAIKGNSFGGSYTNAISPAAVLGGDFGPNRCDGSIAHVATPGATSLGIRTINQSGTVLTLQGSESRARVYLTYSASMTPDASLGNIFTIDVSNGTAFTIANPTNYNVGQSITFHIRNASGGAMGLITWGAEFKLAGAFTNPANGQMRSITFTRDGYAFWYEGARAAADVPAT